MVKRFLNADVFTSTGQGFLGYNMFAYCGNNPVDRLDPFGEEWYHWAIGAAIVTACAIATVATCGMSLAAAATAVGMVANGMAAATTASTVAAAAFVGSATVYGTAALSAASNSNSVDEFYAQGNWGTVIATAGGGMLGGFNGYSIANAQEPQELAPAKSEHLSGTGNPNNYATPNGSYTKLDSNGNIYSYTTFNSEAQQYMRIDFQGRPHAGVLPHIHIYTYLERGGRVEYTFNMNWDLLH